jgi:DNA-binding response OmpR family regulator
MSRVTLLGLPEELERQLTQVLREEAHKVVRKRHLQDLRHGPKSGAVFISGDAPDFRGIIARLREGDPNLPIIVVTHRAGTTEWLDALDAGATDYCGAPFERMQVRCILESAIRPEVCAA